MYYLGFGGHVPTRVRRLVECHQVSEYLVAEKEIANTMFDPVLDSVLPDLALVYGQVEAWWTEVMNEEKKANKGKLFTAASSMGMGLRRKKGRNTQLFSGVPDFGADGI